VGWGAVGGGNPRSPTAFPVLEKNMWWLVRLSNKRSRTNKDAAGPP
jgi:hypothetical protein